jgi:hypothetical protein
MNGPQVVRKKTDQKGSEHIGNMHELSGALSFLARILAAPM